MQTDIIEEIKYGKIVLPPNGKIYDISDTHIPEQNTKILEKVIRHIAKKPKERKVLKGGDLIDAYLLNPFANTPKIKFEDIEGELQTLMRITKPILSQIVAINWGNHEERLFRGVKQGSADVLQGVFSFTDKVRDENPDVVVAPLGRGVRLDIECGEQTYEMYMAHSRGHKRYMYWTEFNRAIALFPNQDVFLFRHAHEYNVQIHRYIKPDRTIGRTMFIRGGTYTPYLAYAEKFLLPPSDVGSVTLQFDPKKHRLPIVDFTGRY